MTPESAAEHHRARRQAEMQSYSRSVRWMKVALPVGAIGLIGLIFLMGTDRGAVIDLGETRDATMLAAGLKLENPRFAGTTDDGDPFVVTAKSALPDGAVPDEVELELPSGEIRLADGKTVKVNADDGLMFRKDEELHLMGDVTLTTSDGYKVVTERVEIDLDTKAAVVPGEIRASGPLGSLRADRMRVDPAAPESRDVVIRFEGNVKIVYQGTAE